MFHHSNSCFISFLRSSSNFEGDIKHSADVETNIKRENEERTEDVAEIDSKSIPLYSFLLTKMDMTP